VPWRPSGQVKILPTHRAASMLVNEHFEMFASNNVSMTLEVVRWLVRAGRSSHRVLVVSGSNYSVRVADDGTDAALQAARRIFPRVERAGARLA
jgi:hypothetical protein